MRLCRLPPLSLPLHRHSRTLKSVEEVRYMSSSHVETMIDYHCFPRIH